MNIFVLSATPLEAARWHVDKHIVKMPLESAQMLCTALHRHKRNPPYKPVHVKHPCTLWCGDTRDNFEWLCELGLELCKEFTFRYGKIHSSEKVISYCASQLKAIPYGSLTTFAMAMPIEHKRPCPIEAYREYYRKSKDHIASWKLREEPYWYRVADVVNCGDVSTV